MAGEEAVPADGLKALLDAIREGEIERIAALLRESLSLTAARDERGYTALQCAVWEGKPDAREAMVRLLTDAGAEVDIHVACALNRAERVEALLKEDPALVHATSPDGWSLMHQVGRYGGIETARVLVAHGADADRPLRDRQGGRALHEACGRADVELATFLLDHGAEVNPRDAYGRSPLHAAIGTRKPAADVEACLRLLLARGADAAAVDPNGHTPLRSAVWAGDVSAQRVLREQGAPTAGTRPACDPPAETTRLVERLLAEVWGGPVALGDCYQLRGERVLRCEIAAAPKIAGRAAPASVVVKQARRDEKNPYNPDAVDRWNGAWGLFEDWAGTRLFASLAGGREYGTRFYAGDRAAGVIVIEDLGDGEALVDRLMGHDPGRAEEGLRLLAECLGKMHAETIGQAGRYWEYRDALGPRVARSWLRPMEEYRERLRNGFAAVGVEPAAGFEAEFAQLAAAMAEPGPFLAYVHGDPCPDNVRIVDGRVRLFDFETSGFRHALLDAVYGRILFPTCWCVNRLPAHVAPMMEAAYRAELVRGCPAAADDGRFSRELVHCCAAWLIMNGIWMLDNARRDDWRWGISTWRQRVLLRLDALADTTEEFGHLLAVGATARRCTERLREIWPEDADAMPLYPAFRDGVRQGR